MTFEDDYLDVLESIEAVTIGVYQAHPELADFQVDVALNWAQRVYQAEGRGRAAPPVPAGLPGALGTEIVQACQWHLGRATLEAESEPVAQVRTVDEIIACLKRLQRSVKIWTKDGGRQGYLTFVSEFIESDE